MNLYLIHGIQPDRTKYILKYKQYIKKKHNMSIKEFDKLKDVKIDITQYKKDYIILYLLNSVINYVNLDEGEKELLSKCKLPIIILEKLDSAVCWFRDFDKIPQLKAVFKNRICRNPELNNEILYKGRYNYRTLYDIYKDILEKDILEKNKLEKDKLKDKIKKGKEDLSINWSYERMKAIHENDLKKIKCCVWDFNSSFIGYKCFNFRDILLYYNDKTIKRKLDKKINILLRQDIFSDNIPTLEKEYFKYVKNKNDLQLYTIINKFFIIDNIDNRYLDVYKNNNIKKIKYNKIDKYLNTINIVRIIDNDNKYINFKYSIIKSIYYKKEIECNLSIDEIFKVCKSHSYFKNIIKNNENILHLFYGDTIKYKTVNIKIDNTNNIQSEYLHSFIYKKYLVILEEERVIHKINKLHFKITKRISKFKYRLEKDDINSFYNTTSNKYIIQLCDLIKVKKKYDVFCVNNKKDGLQGLDREKCKKIIRNMKNIISVTDDYLNNFEYYKKLIQSKICIACWGWGEWVHLDANAFYSGTILIKPDTDYVKTYPDLYQNGKTYIACKPDYSDLQEIIENILENYEMYNDMIMKNKLLVKSISITTYKLIDKFCNEIRNSI